MTVDHLARAGFVASSALGGGVIATAAIPADHAATIALLVAAVAVVAAGIAWIDGRIDRRMKAHEAAEFEKDDARGRLETERHDHVVRELERLHERIDLRAEIRSMRQERPG